MLHLEKIPNLLSGNRKVPGPFFQSGTDSIVKLSGKSPCLPSPTLMCLSVLHNWHSPRNMNWHIPRNMSVSIRPDNPRDSFALPLRSENSVYNIVQLGLPKIFIRVPDSCSISRACWPISYFCRHLTNILRFFGTNLPFLNISCYVSHCQLSQNCFPAD